MSAETDSGFGKFGLSFGFFGYKKGRHSKKESCSKAVKKPVEKLLKNFSDEGSSELFSNFPNRERGRGRVFAAASYTARPFAAPVRLERRFLSG